MANYKKIMLLFPISLLMLYGCSSFDRHLERNPSSISKVDTCSSSLFKIVNANESITIYPEKYLDIEAYISSKSRPDSSIEIGPSKFPICPDCIPVDRYRNIAENKFDVLKKTSKIPETMSFEKWLKLNPEVEEKMIEEGNAWAVNNKNGIIADAMDLPFQNNSLSFIVMNHFPTRSLEHTPESDEIFLVAVISELSRVLKVGEGEIFATGAFGEKDYIKEIMILHGFKIQKLYNTEDKYLGIILTK